MPKLRGQNPSAVRADVASEGPFGSTRFLRPRKVHGNFRAVALLNPSVGKQRGMTNKVITIYSQQPVYLREAGSPLRYFNQLGLVVLCINAGLRSMRGILHFPFEKIPES
jgi:hypothetical protein